MATKYTINNATKNDIKDIFELSNDELVRKNSINQDKIIWENHIEWFYKRIKSVNPFYIIRSYSNDLIAQVRLDKNEENIISVSISKNYRGKGLSAKIIKDCSERSGFNEINAYIKKDNIASQKAFKKAGYVFVSENGDFLKFKYIKNRVYIIAEMSANHCGDKELAKKIIAKAKEIGADAVKVQTYTADTITIDCDNEEFQIKDKDSLWNGENLYKLYKKAYTPWEWQGELKEYADSIGIDFFSTPFDYTAVDFLESINVPCYKIASFEAMDYPLIKYTAKLGKPMIISTGVSSLEEIQDAIDACKSVGNNDITILKCTSAYPAKLEDMNIVTIKDMFERFAPQGVKIGLSDHSLSNIPAITAVSLGATVVEKHFTLDRNLGGADAGFSLEPNEFKSLVEDIRATEKVLGTVDYTINEINRKFARSLYAVKDIKKGEKFTPDNIRSIRPSNGLHPKYYEEILGKTATYDIKFGTPLKKDFYIQ